MSLPSTSVKHPVTIIMAVISVMIVGIVALIRLPVDYYPNIEFPVIAVSTTYKGAAPEEVEKSITRVIEGAVSGVNGINYIESTSAEGSSMVTINFQWGQNLDAAANDVREKLDLIKRVLPEGASTPAIFKFSSSMMPVMGIGFTGSENLEYLYNLADTQIKPKLEQADGVATANIAGGFKKEVHVDVSKNRLLAYGLDIENIAKILAMENQNVAGGYVYEGVYKYVLRTTGEYKDLEDIKNIVLTVKNGIPIRLKDIANVSYGYSDSTGIVRLNGKSGITLFINKEAGRNTVTVAKNIYKKLKEIEQTLPPGIKYQIIFDSSKDIENSINNVRDAAIQGAILAILILMIYLWNIRTVSIIGISIPTSIITTFILMYFFNVTLNIVSLAGLALGVGMMVDSSIVVLENIFYHRQKKEGRFTAAVKGTEEVMLAVTASTFTTVAVFLPIVFVQGFTAQVFRDLALTVTISLLSSLVVSITLVPMLSSKMVVLKENKLLKPIEDFFIKMINEMDEIYGRILSKLLKHKKAVILTTFFGVLAIGAVLTVVMGKEGMPTVDEGNFNINATFPVGTRIEFTDKITREMEKVVAGIAGQNLRSMVVRINSGGFWGSPAEYKSSIRVGLIDKEKRTESQEKIVERIRQAMKSFPAKINVSYSMTSRFTTAEAPIVVEIRGDDLKISEKISKQVVDILNTIDGVRDPQSSREDALPEVKIAINSDLASKVGLNAMNIAQSVQTAFGGRAAATTIKSKEGTDIDVIVRLQEEDRLNIDSILSLNLPTPIGKQVPLASIVTREKAYGPVTIYRKDAIRTTKVTADSYGRTTSEIMKDIQSRVEKEVFLPSGFSITYSGSYKDFEESALQLILAFALAIILVYAIMASQFESLIAPFVIMFAVPFGYTGALVFIFLTGKPISIIGIIGIVVLAGIVVNNGIVLLDYMNQLLHKGLPVEKAAVEAGKRRLRPVMMTTMTTVLGLIPMALGLGQGGELYSPLALSILGGLTISTLFTLIVVPTTYAAIRNRFKLKKYED